jgi:Xaa-Pro dipeptidase
MQWTKEQIKDHGTAAKLLVKIKNETLRYIKTHKDISEFETSQFAQKQFRKYGLKTNHIPPIVSFCENTSFVHYHPSQYSKKLKPETLIMLDIWARLNKKGAPFADVTFMAYYGKNIPAKFFKLFKIVCEARDGATNFLKHELRKKTIPTGKKIDATTRNYIEKHGFGKEFLHGTGHSLGLTSPHGSGVRINRKNKKNLSRNVGYTIEPGIYLKDKFGVRSEIDFYIDENYKMIITSEAQKKIIILLN